MYRAVGYPKCVLAWVCLLVALLATPAFGQERVPDKGMKAIGLSAGFALPDEDVLDNGFYMAVNGDYFLTPRVAVRGQFGGAFFDFTGGVLHQKMSPWHLSGSLVYNWERGKWHPYVGAGVGVYKYRFGEGSDRPSFTKGGGHLGGGIEYFFTRTDTIAGDVTWHLVPGTIDEPGFGYKPRFWTITAGYRKYF